MLDVVFSVLLILLFGVPVIIFFDKLLEDCKKFLVYRRKADNIYNSNIERMMYEGYKYEYKVQVIMNTIRCGLLSTFFILVLVLC